MEDPPWLAVAARTSGLSTAASTLRWHLCSSHYRVNLWMPEAGGLVGDGEDHEQLMHALGCSPSGRSPGSGSGSAPPWPPRPANRAAISAAARLTDTGSLTRV